MKKRIALKIVRKLQRPKIRYASGGRAWFVGPSWPAHTIDRAVARARALGEIG